MSLIPAFKLDFWNAWIFILPLLVLWLTFMQVNKKKMEDSKVELTRKEKKLFPVLQVTIFVSFIYSVFLPLKLDTAWFYVGLFIYLVGIIFIATAWLSFATTPMGKPVTKWVYHISRNPMDFGWIWTYVGIGIACSSWLYLLFAVMAITLMDFFFTNTEERFCLEKYGDAYQEYMDKTPKWIGIPKSREK